VFEKNDRIGGLLRYGIPDFKMQKHHIDRRLAQMLAEGVQFHTDTHVGVDVSASKLVDEFDAVVLTGGAEHPRDLEVPGRHLDGVHFAMALLTQQNRINAGDTVDGTQRISAKDRHVIVIGGGDTGSDCIGTSFRQGALSVTQLEILPRPPEKENKALTWPNWPLKLRTSSSQEEGAQREWSVSTKALAGENGRVTAWHGVRLKWSRDGSGQWRSAEIPGSELRLEADLVLLAMGFIHPVHEGLLRQLGVGLDPRGNVEADTNNYRSSIPKVFSAGDMRRGQSLVVWAIREGRQAAAAVDEFLMGHSDLPR
jgi:glutamate synthase (NADPH/NADH) small chain